MHLCGVVPEMSKTLREILASALQVEELLLLDGEAAIAAQPGYQSRGQAVRAVLEQLPNGPCAIERVSVTGHLVGFWGTPFVWDPKIGRMRQLDFGRFDPGVRERARAHPPPSTKAGRFRENIGVIGSAPRKGGPISYDSTIHSDVTTVG
jgi:hypothetical protein